MTTQVSSDEAKSIAGILLTVLLGEAPGCKATIKLLPGQASAARSQAAYVIDQMIGQLHAKLRKKMVPRAVADRLADTVERELLAPISLEDRRATIAKAVDDYRKAVK